MNEIIIRNQDMPYFIKGQVLLDSNGDYNIYINAKLSTEIQKKVLKHELNHVKNMDFNNNDSIYQIEGIRGRQAD